VIYIGTYRSVNILCAINLSYQDRRGWLGAISYVQDEFVRMSPDLAKTVVYACRSIEIIHSASKLLIGRGLVERWFYSDAFVASGPI
jgi:hypothetical protein